MIPHLLQLRALAALHRLGGSGDNRSAAAPAPRAGVSRPMSAAARAIVDEGIDWSGQRAPQRPTDQMVRPHTQAWLRQLPAACWPSELASRFPRVANQVALVWPDAALAERALDRLLSDERGGRQGFPSGVRRDLEALRRLRRSLVSGDEAAALST